MQKASKIILGIDPGTLIMGYGLIRVNGTSIELLEMGALKLSSRHDAYQRLGQIHKRVVSLTERFLPDAFAIEAPFYGKNVQSMLKLGRAQGVAIAAAMSAGLCVHEYSPKKVKQSVTGNGNASKEQVQKMLQQLVKFEEEPKHFDASDALAVAICHHFQERNQLPSTTGKAKNWNDFIMQNPARLR